MVREAERAKERGEKWSVYKSHEGQGNPHRTGGVILHALAHFLPKGGAVELMGASGGRDVRQRYCMR